MGLDLSPPAELSCLPMPSDDAIFCTNEESNIEENPPLALSLPTLSLSSPNEQKGLVCGQETPLFVARDSTSDCRLKGAASGELSPQHVKENDVSNDENDV